VVGSPVGSDNRRGHTALTVARILTGRKGMKRKHASRRSFGKEKDWEREGKDPKDLTPI